MSKMYPIEEIRKFQREMDKTFENFFKRKPFERAFSSMERAFKAFKEPLSEVTEKDNNVVVNVELPGVEKKDIILQVTNDHVEVRAGKNSNTKIQKKDYYKEEKSYRGFHRVITLPVEVKADEARADYKNGVLTLTIPKLKKKLVKKIEVK